MAWLDGFSDLKTTRERAETAFYAPIGMMSPLWIAFGAAASAGAAFWLMSRLAKPFNIEAAMALPSEGRNVEVAVPVSAEAAVLAAVDTTSVDVVAEEAELAIGAADDLMQLAGVGPKIAAALAERGIERFEQLAAWTEEDLAAFDAALDLRGRAIRAGFVAQARKLVGG